MNKGFLKKTVVVIVMFFLPVAVCATIPPEDVRKAEVLNKTHRIQIPFIENKGQIEDKDVSFYAKTFGGTVFIGKDGTISYSLPFEDRGGVVIKEVLTENEVEIKGLDPSPTKINYFKGNDQSKWRTNIPSYNSVSLGEIYKGVELTLKAYGKNVEKLFKVLPGRDPGEIKVTLKGAKGLQVNGEGELEVITELDSVRFTKPIAYQEIDGKRVGVKVSYVINKENTYGFEVDSHDKTRPLIIDPLIASTFIGGDFDDFGNSIALDESGNVYVTGQTGSSSYPTTPGAHDQTISFYDVFISKLDSTLTTLLASTYIGGVDGSDNGNSIALDESGNVYVTGCTNSSSYPTTSGAYDETYNGYYDGFVSKLDNTLTTLLASTYTGGENGDDYGRSLTLDGSGNVYVTGHTRSSSYPTTPGAYDETYNGGGDVFVSQLDSTLTTLLASTYIGGGVGGDYGNSIALDESGNVYVAGETRSSSYPTTPGAYDETYNGPSDVFISKLDNTLTTLLASTYIGGGVGYDNGSSIALDESGNVYVTGHTGASDYPTTPGAYDETYNGCDDVFVSQLDSTLTTLLASTFVGGGYFDHANSLTLDGSGNVYVAGWTDSFDYPSTPGAYDETYNDDNVNYDYDDGFISKLDNTLTTLLASTYIGGGDGWDDCGSIALDGSGNVYVTGWTNSFDYPTTPGAYDETYNSYDDVFVSKLDSTLFLAGTIDLANMYVDDTGTKDYLVYKVGNDLIEIVHVIRNSGASSSVINLKITVPGTWEFRKWYKRTASGDLNAEEHQDGYQYLMNWLVDIIYIPSITIPANSTVQVGIRFLIPNPSAPVAGGSVTSEVGIGTPDTPSWISLGTLSTSGIQIYRTDNIQTLAIIVTNRNQLYNFHGDIGGTTTQLLRKLYELAFGYGGGRMSAVIYYADWYDEDFKSWDNLDPNLYNSPHYWSNKLKTLIQSWMRWNQPKHPSYILLVGGDEVIPFKRQNDQVGDENDDPYPLTVTQNGFFFNDSFYADLVGDDYIKGEIEAKIGRIASPTPYGMYQFIERGQAGPQYNNVSKINRVVLASQGGGNCLAVDRIYDAFDDQGFTILNDGGTNDTIESTVWDCADFRDAVDRGVKYIVDYSHANHLSFQAGTGQICNITDDNFFNSNIAGNYFVALGGCHSGALEDRRRTTLYSHYFSSMAYGFQWFGACGYIGSTGYSYAFLGNCSKLGYGSLLFNDIFYHIFDNYIGNALYDALKRYDAGYIWEDSDKKTVTEFILYGLPWMPLNVPIHLWGSFAAAESSDKGFEITKLNPQLAGGGSGYLGGSFAASTYTTNYVFTVTEHTISQEDSFDVISIPGGLFDYAQFKPMLPMLKATLNLPKGASVLSIQLIDNTSQTLGQLNIPNSQASTSVNPMPPYTEYTDVTGVYPVPNYGYDIDNYEDHVEVKIYLIPFQHNVDTNETEIWEETTLQVEYSVDNTIFVSDFSGKSECTTTEDITASAVVENAGDVAVSDLSAVLTVKDSNDQEINSTSESLSTIPAGGSVEAQLNMSNGLSTGTYFMQLEIKDIADTTVAISTGYIKVTSEFIADFQTPEQSNKLDDIPFTVSFQNNSLNQISVDIEINIYNSKNEQITTITAPSENVPSESSEDIVVFWDSDEKETGNYYAMVKATVDQKVYFDEVSFMVICGSGSDADSDGLCDDEDNCPEIPNGIILGTCSVGTIGDSCTIAGPNELECGTSGYCDMIQEDTYPPGGNGCGDACECHADCNDDQKVNLGDLVIMKGEFLRTNCDNPEPCDADCNYDTKVDLSDLVMMKNEFLRTDCPVCP